MPLERVVTRLVLIISGMAVMLLRVQGNLHSRGSQPEQDIRDMQREDSASYQRRPPALAERQDSASNLQVTNLAARLVTCLAQIPW